MRYFTQSELKTWRRCKRKWWLSTYRRLQLREEFVKPGAGTLGTLVHRCLEAWSKQEDWRQPLRDAEARAQELYFGDRLDKWMKQCQLAEIMVEGFFEWAEEEGLFEGITRIAPERKVAVALTEDIGLMGKLDELVTDHWDESVAFIDYKTVGGFLEIIKRAPIDEQFLHYELIQALSEPDVKASGGIWVMLRKVKRTARATPPFYETYRLQHNKTQLRNYYKKVWRMITEIRDFEKELDETHPSEHPILAYTTPTNDCSWDCDFRDVCPMFDDGSRAEDMIEELYVEGDPLERYSTDEEGSEDE